YQADHALASDAKPAVAALVEEMSRSIQTVPPAQVVKDGHQSKPIAHAGAGVHPGQLAQSLSKLLPDNSVILADAGTHLAWLAYYLELSRGQNYRKPGGFGPMAGHVNGALGLKCA